MKNNKKGFIVPLLIAIVVLFALGGGYYYMSNKFTLGTTPANSQNNNSFTTQVQTSTSSGSIQVENIPATITDSTSTVTTTTTGNTLLNLKTFTNQTGLYTFSYPSSWYYIEQVQLNTTLYETNQLGSNQLTIESILDNGEFKIPDNSSKSAVSIGGYSGYSYQDSKKSPGYFIILNLDPNLKLNLAIYTLLNPNDDKKFLSGVVSILKSIQIHAEKIKTHYNAMVLKDETFDLAGKVIGHYRQAGIESKRERDSVFDVTIQKQIDQINTKNDSHTEMKIYLEDIFNPIPGYSPTPNEGDIVVKMGDKTINTFFCLSTNIATVFDIPEDQFNSRTDCNNKPLK